MESSFAQRSIAFRTRISAASNEVGLEVASLQHKSDQELQPVKRPNPSPDEDATGR